MPEYIKHPDLASHTEILYEAEDYHTTGGSAHKVYIESDATATPTAGKIPIADGSGKLDGWITSLVSLISDAAFDEATWNADTTHAASKNAIRDWIMSHITGASPHIGAADNAYVSMIGGSGGGATNGAALFLFGPDHAFAGQVRLYTINTAKDGAVLALQITSGDAPVVNVVGSLTVNGVDTVLVTGNQTVAGVKTFSSFPVTPSAAPTTDYQVSNKKYVDDSVGAGSVGFAGVNAVVVGANADATIKTWANAAHVVFGDLVAVCDGTADQTEINAAITALTADRTWIETVKLIGDFACSASITMASYTRLDLTEAYFTWDAASTLITATGTLEAAAPAPIALSASAAKGDDTITVAAGGDGFADGDWVIVRDEGTTLTFKDGEIHKVISGVATTITIEEALWMAHTTGNTATIQKVNMVDHIEIIGGRIVGADPVQVKDCRAIDLIFCANYVVRDVVIEDICMASIWAISSVHGEITGNKVSGSGRTGYGYGIALTSACKAVNIHDNIVTNCRHDSTMGGSGSYYGAPIACSTNNNSFLGGIAGEGSNVVDCHECNALGCVWNNNVVIGPDDTNYAGLHLGCPQWTANGNTVYAKSNCICDRGNSVVKATCHDNVILQGSGGGIILNSTGLLYVDIDGVEFTGAITAMPVGVDTGTAAGFASIRNVHCPMGSSGNQTGIWCTDFDMVVIQNCEIRNMNYTGIYVTGADKGSIQNCICSNNNQASSGTTAYQHGIYLGTCTYMLISGNHCFDDQTGSETQKYGIYEGPSCNNNTITGNKCWGNDTGPYYITGAASTLQVAPFVEHHTADDTLTMGETDSIHTNKGDGDTQTLTLPASAPMGTNFTFCVMAAQEMRIKISAASKSFYASGAISTDDGGGDLYISADDEGETLKLVADGDGNWFAAQMNGTWTVTQP